ncbi:MAG: prolipoprotein diacylglyceryl transferase [Candidatus Omnitrophota bacterium]|nr:prolipoprotein diacylglyceryl transferase [Candidatus Omnitrophota bacterium]
MYPIILQIGPFTIYSYGLLLALASFVSIFLLTQEGKKQGFKADILLDFCFWILVSGIIGARIFYILLNLHFFQENPKEILMLWHGGLVWFGGLIAAIIFGILFLKIKRQPILKTLDLICPYAALAQAIGRIGCFLNGCCFGRPLGFGIFFPVHQMKLFPAQLLSTFNLIIIFFILKLKQKKVSSEGEMLFFYLILISLERFILEFLRGDSPRIIWNLTIFQIFSLIILIVALYGKNFLHSRNPRQ